MIKVDAIDTNTAVNSYISFTGEQARELMKVLPRVSSAGGPHIEEHSHALAVMSPGYMVTIN